MRHQQFDEAVKRSLFEVAHKLEVAEAQRYLEEDLREMIERNSGYGNLSIGEYYTQTQSFTFGGGTFSFTQTIVPPSSSTEQTPSTIPAPSMPSLQVPRSQQDNTNEVTERSQALQKRQLEHYLANKYLVDEVIYNMLSPSNSRPLSERVDNNYLRTELTDQFANERIDIPFHYVFTTNTGRVI